MYHVEIHTFNECGHFHSQMFFGDGDRGKKLVPYLNGEISKLIKDGFNCDDFRCYTENNGKPIVVYTFCKVEPYVNNWVDIIVREVKTEVLYEYDC